MNQLDVTIESWPIAGTFTIARGSKTVADVVVARLQRDGHSGRGECVPYPRYGETPQDVAQTLEKLRPQVEAGLDRQALQEALPPGAARNALDCAFWDLEAKTSGTPVHQLAGLPEPAPLTTAYTLSLDTPATMGAAAQRHADRPLLKIKLAGQGDIERIEAIRQNAPLARLVVDANEGWFPPLVEHMAAALARHGVVLIEQPLPADEDEVLSGLRSPIPLCADESCHTAADVPDLAQRYQCVNIKLDKTGGLTEALKLRQAARDAGLQVMVGCMVGTSLSMAPAVLLAQDADFVDLDGPLLLKKDRDDGLRYDGSLVHPPAPNLWG